DYRKPSVDARRRSILSELASKQLSEMRYDTQSRCRRYPPVKMAGYKIVKPIRTRRAHIVMI
ncbi:MAG TPA: hypothetical protein VN626_05045, partial [Clostridia bacterium]|nr:hypothetical protein [Clostridia bacterium]